MVLKEIMNTADNTIRINVSDNVGVVLQNLNSGDFAVYEGISVAAVDSIEKGHKIALKKISVGEYIVKYGFTIGHATQTIEPGQCVHTHNMSTNLSGISEYVFKPFIPKEKAISCGEFMGYVRDNGEIGIRNEIWILTTVGCVNSFASALARKAEMAHEGKTDGIHVFTHPYGCSQLGNDLLNTQKILSALVKHPNAAGVLVVGLGCENNNLNAFCSILGEYDERRTRFLETQKAGDEMEEGLRLIEELVEHAKTYHREKCPLSKLIVGLKCGGSDAFSGITANPLVGEFTDTLLYYNSTALLTEVPEMFGAEKILMERCETEDIFLKTVELVNGFKNYYLDHKQPVYENPSPGNMKGGITTLEEKSLGCILKGGRHKVTGVLEYGEKVKSSGLKLVWSPGNDIVSSTALTAAGAHLILFTTGRGTPMGAPVPTIKISTTSQLFNSKRNWMDFDAGGILENGMSKLKNELFDYVLKVASGDEKTKNEVNGYREIAIFKDGVTL
jgi:altronate hydrolase